MTKYPCQAGATPAVFADVISPPASFLTHQLDLSPRVELPACFCCRVSCSYTVMVTSSGPLRSKPSSSMVKYSN